jgi:hypothetical protein
MGSMNVADIKRKKKRKRSDFTSVTKPSWISNEYSYERVLPPVSQGSSQVLVDLWLLASKGKQLATTPCSASIRYGRS